MKIHEYKEREDGGADIEVELTPEESRILIRIGLIKMLKDIAKEYEKQFDDRVEAAWKDYKDEEDL